MTKTVQEPIEVSTKYVDRLLTQLEPDKSIRKFDQILRADQVAPNTRKAYFEQLLRVKRLLPKNVVCDLGDLTEDTLLDVLGTIADKAKGTGYLMTARTMKRFYNSIGRKDLVERIRLPHVKSRLPDILTNDELRTLLAQAGSQDGNLRNRVVVELLWETGCRVGELCALKIKDVQFDQYSAIVHLNGKTGERRIRAFSCRPDLLEYLNNHQFRNNPNAYLFIANDGHGGPSHRLTESGVRKLLATLSKSVLNRKIHPHMLRHTRATELSRYMTDRELKIFGGWKRTQMLEVYSHLSGKDVDDKLLKLHGFKINDNDMVDAVNVRLCRQADCKAENSPMAIYCQKCGTPLTSDSTEDLLKDTKFIAGLAQNREFLDLLKKQLK